MSCNKKLRDKRRQQRIKRLRRRREQVVPLVTKDFIREAQAIMPGTRVVNLGGPKMSDILIDFAKPLLSDDMSDSEYRMAISIAVIGWNLEEVGRSEDITAQLEDFRRAIPPAGQAEFNRVIEMLFARKRKRFDSIRRIITHHEVKREGDFRHVMAAYTLTNAPPG